MSVKSKACPCGCGHAPSPQEGGKSKMRPLECPVCRVPLRVARAQLTKWHELYGHLPVCPCGCEMECPCLFDRLAYSEDAARAHPAYGKVVVGFTVSQAVREAGKGLSGADRMQCGGCRRWIRRANEHCGCGFANDVRGHRNHGHYGATVNRSREEIPF